MASVIERLGLARLYQGDGSYLIAWVDGVPRGHAYLTHANPPELQDLEVDRQYRRRGVARALVAAVAGSALASGATTLRLMVSASNLDAQGLYRGLGFADTGADAYRVRGVVSIRTGPLTVDETLLTWEKPLTSLEGPSGHAAPIS